MTDHNMRAVLPLSAADHSASNSAATSRKMLGFPS
jgi:hypothetical protein